jgi:photosystem II stability/assembly factor-like uncharacterized protein
MCRENGAGRGARRPRLHPPPRADPGIWIFAREFVNLGVLPSNERPTGSQGVRPPCPTHSPLREEEMERNTPSRYARACVVTAAALLAVTASDLSAQRNARAAAQANPSTVDAALLGGLEWRNIGPNRGGRSIGTAGSTARPMEYYFGATGGGLWKTTDGGTTWDPVTDGQINSASVGAVAVCEANPDVVYITTGETQLRGNIQPGDGVYKSTDAGKTWTHIGLKEARNFSRVRIHPTDCDRVFVGAFGEYGIENAERGVYRTTDGGTSWQKVLFRDDKTGAVDISIDQRNPNVVYAALWEAFRKPWAMSSGGPGSGLFKSTDGGATWTELSRNPGLPQGMLGKIGVSVSPANPDRVFAIIEAEEGGVFRSDDAGATWTKLNDERKLRQRAFYYTRIVADPVDAERVYVLNVGFFRSDDGGKTFPTAITVPHGDNHDLWIAANDNRRMVQANDGGANVSVNAGESWTNQNYATAQMYRISATSHEPFMVCGGQQDNSTACVPTKGWEHLYASPGLYRGVRQQQATGNFLFAAGGCESGYVTNHPTNPNVFYSGCYGGALERYDHETGQSRPVDIWPENRMGQSSEDFRERVQWTFPIIFSPHDPNVLYTTSQHVWRTTNEGQSWERISPDLTRADPSTLGPSGGPITKDQTGVETFATVFTLAPSRLERDVIWTGSDDGLVYITRDGGRNWQNVTPAGMPDFVKITTVEDSPHKPGAAYMTGHRFLLGDYAPYVYRTTDYGRTWTKITDGIPADEVARSIREDVSRPGLLFLGTERGVWVSFNDGGNWQPLQLNLPVVQVPDLVVKGNDLAIATHGRSFWVLDNIDILRQITPAVQAKTAHLFTPAPSVRGVDNGLAIDYFLRRPARSVKIDILDRSGQVIRSFEGTGEDARGVPSTKAGSNRFVWDMRYPPFTEFPGMILWFARTTAPMAVPGQYQVRLTVDGQTQTQTAEIRVDPRVRNVTLADLQARFDLAMQIRNRTSEANEAVIRIRDMKSQIDERIAAAPQQQGAYISSTGQSIKASLSAIEEEIYQVRNQSNQDPLNFPIKINNKLAALLSHVEGGEARPTDQSHAVFQMLSEQLDQQLSALNRVVDQELAQYNQQLQAARLQPVRPALATPVVTRP